MSEERPRYTQVALPPYSYVPGHAPHPASDPAGHMYGEPHQTAAALQIDSWQDSPEFLFGVDLFNHGFYWEAHEAWESLWHAAGRKGSTADFLKGLIKLAAAAVKAREGNPRGVQRHAARAKELLSGDFKSNYCGLDILELIALADALSDKAATYDQAQPTMRLDLVLKLNVD